MQGRGHDAEPSPGDGVCFDHCHRVCGRAIRIYGDSIRPIEIYGAGPLGSGLNSDQGTTPLIARAERGSELVGELGGSNT